MPPLPEAISDDLSDFLSLCFIKDPEARPKANMMFEHPWVKKYNPEMVLYLVLQDITSLISFQALRPQDSVPFLRRVSTDLRRVDSSRLFVPTPAYIEQGSKIGLNGPNGIDTRSRESVTSLQGRDGSDGGQNQHALITRTFAKGKPLKPADHS